jgi:hypothetical protein
MKPFILACLLAGLSGGSQACRAQSASAAAGLGASACLAAPTSDHIVEVTSEADLVLGSGGVARLMGLRFPPAPPFRDEALAQLQALVGQPLLVSGGAERDRWGRLPIQARVIDEMGGVDLAEKLIEAGLALVAPNEAESFCQPELLALEENARERKLGLWADALYNPLDADHISRLQDRFGTFVLVEGRVQSIGERKQRIYLNFGGHWAEDFTIVIPRRTWKTMMDRGWKAADLKGQRIRARGILEPWQGAALTVVVPEMIERLDGPRPSR